MDEQGVVSRHHDAQTAHAGAPPRVAIAAASSDSAARDPGHAFVQWRPQIQATLRRRGVLDCMLEDALQDIFEVACRSWDRFEGRSTRRTWLIGIAIRVAYGYARRRAIVEMCVPLPIPVGATPQLRLQSYAIGDPFETARRREAEGRLWELVFHMTEPQRQMFVLVEIWGASVSEAALRIGVTPRIASRRLARAREVIKAGLVKHHAGNLTQSGTYRDAAYLQRSFMEWTAEQDVPLRAKAVGVGPYAERDNA